MRWMDTTHPRILQAHPRKKKSKSNDLVKNKLETRPPVENNLSYTISS